MANCICSSMSKLSVSGNTTLKSFEGFKAGATFRLSAPVQTRTTIQVATRAPVKIMAARVANVEIPNAKRIATSLTYVYGIGPTTAAKIMSDLDMDNKRTYDLSEEELTALRAEVDKYVVEGDLRRQIALDIKRLKEIGCYRGRRHWAGLPMRGQRTKNNARTRKGRSGMPVVKKK